jgi:hypothetical protein
MFHSARGSLSSFGDRICLVIGGAIFYTKYIGQSSASLGTFLPSRM